MNVAVNNIQDVSPMTAMAASEHLVKNTDYVDEHTDRKKAKKGKNLYRTDYRKPNMVSKQTTIHTIAKNFAKMNPAQLKNIVVSLSMASALNSLANTSNDNTPNTNGFMWYVLIAWTNSMKTKQRGEMTQIGRMTYINNALTEQQRILAKLHLHMPKKAEGFVETMLKGLPLFSSIPGWDKVVDGYMKLTPVEQGLIAAAVIGGIALVSIAAIWLLAVVGTLVTGIGAMAADIFAGDMAAAGAEAIETGEIFVEETDGAASSVATLIEDAGHGISEGFESVDLEVPDSGDFDAIIDGTVDAAPAEAPAPAEANTAEVQAEETDAVASDDSEDSVSESNRNSQERERGIQERERAVERRQRALDDGTYAKRMAKMANRAEYKQLVGNFVKGAWWGTKKIVGTSLPLALGAGVAAPMMIAMGNNTGDQMAATELSTDTDSVNLSIKRLDGNLDQATSYVNDENQRVEEAARNLGDLIESNGRAATLSV